MIWPFGTIGYGIGALVCWRMVSGHLAWRFFENHSARYPSLARGMTRPNGEHWFGAASLGLCAACVWPLMAIAALVTLPAVGAEKEAIMRAREKRVKDMERELGL